LAIASAAAEVVYFIFLSESYRRGELSVMFPLTRGVSTVLQVFVGLLLLREQLTSLQAAGVACLLVSILAVQRPLTRTPGLVPAMLTSASITVYSAIDAAGVRMAPAWLYAWALWVGMGAMLTAWVRLPGMLRRLQRLRVTRRVAAIRRVHRYRE